jgi:hypothetical protein
MEIILNWYIIFGIITTILGTIGTAGYNVAIFESKLYDISLILQGISSFICLVLYNELVYYIIGIYFLFIKYPDLPWWVGVILLSMMYIFKQRSIAGVEQGFVHNHEIRISNSFYNVVTIAIISYGIPYLDNLFK